MLAPIDLNLLEEAARVAAKFLKVEPERVDDPAGPFIWHELAGQLASDAAFGQPISQPICAATARQALSLLPKGRAWWEDCPENLRQLRPFKILDPNESTTMLLARTAECAMRAYQHLGRGEVEGVWEVEQDYLDEEFTNDLEEDFPQDQIPICAVYVDGVGTPDQAIGLDFQTLSLETLLRQVWVNPERPDRLIIGIVIDAVPLKCPTTCPYTWLKVCVSDSRCCTRAVTNCGQATQ